MRGICESAGDDRARSRLEVMLIEALRDRARDTAARLPAPPLNAHPDHYAMWEWDMMEAAEGFAAEFGDKHGRLLADALGPPIQVGVAPAWHVLLQIALLYAEADRPKSIQLELGDEELSFLGLRTQR